MGGSWQGGGTPRAPPGDGILDDRLGVTPDVFRHPAAAVDQLEPSARKVKKAGRDRNDPAKGAFNALHHHLFVHTHSGRILGLLCCCYAVADVA